MGKDQAAPFPAWVECSGCDEYFCTIHEVHASECECPPVDEWDFSPYDEGGRKLFSE